MAVAEASVKALKDQVLDLKASVQRLDSANHHLSRDLGAAQKAAAKASELEGQVELLKAELAAKDAKVSSLEASLSAANASLGRAAQVLEAGKQINAALKLLG